MDKRQFLKASAATAAALMIDGMGATFAHAEANVETTVPRTNWSGNYHYSTGKVLQPASVSEVQDAVRSVNSVRALGTRHSFNAIADSTTAQISTLKIKDFRVDPIVPHVVAGVHRADLDLHSVTVGAGIRYGELALLMDAKGLALHNMASLPHISVGGSISTATHGSGMENGNLATAVKAIEFVSADGSVHMLSREKDGDRFAGAVVGLGALGIVTHVTLEAQLRYEMTQFVYQNLPFSALEEHLAEVMGAGYSVSLFTDWQNGRAGEVWVKRRTDTSGTDAPPPTLFGATLAKEKLHPILSHPADACTDQLNTVGPWYERLPHFKLNFTPSSGQEIQTEFFVPFNRGYEAIRAVETLRDKITPHLFISELRTVAADDLWMSMAYRRPSLAIHFTWKPDSEAVLEIVPQIEAKLAPFGARPHWAKVFTMNSAQIDPLYPRANDFIKLARELDPTGKFRNNFLRDHVFTA